MIFIKIIVYDVNSVDAALEDVFASVCSNHKAYSNEKKKTMGKCDFTHIPHGHNGIEERLGIISNQMLIIKYFGHEYFFQIT